MRQFREYPSNSTCGSEPSGGHRLCRFPYRLGVLHERPRMAKSRRDHQPALPSSAALPAVAGAGLTGPVPPHTASTIDDAFFRHIVAGMRNAVLAIARDGHLALINDEAYRIFGLRPGPENLGQPIAAVLKDHPDVVRVLLDVFDLHHVPNRVEMRLKPQQKVIGYTLSLVRDDAGVVVGAAMFFKDLTRVEQLEERERLRDRLAALGQMAAAIAHEVKNPLAGIEVMAGLLRRKIPASPDAQAVLTDIIKEAKMANAIVQEVLDFVRPIRLQVEHTNVAVAVYGAVQLADTKARQGDVTVDVKLPEGLPEIQADEHQLTQVFTNLLMNAYEAMEGQGHVRISASNVRMANAGDGRDGILVEVADDGPGIPPDVAEHVFDPFFTTKPQGSGLGLAIVKKIVDAHDGRIDLRTAPGQGTTVRITLPVTGSDEDS
jgi:signal transduction histidine kinase